MGRKAKPIQSPCRGKEIPKLLSKDRNRQMTILQQKNLRATFEENMKQWTSVASTSRQTQEGPIPPVVATALLHQTSIVCVCGQGSQDRVTSPWSHYLWIFSTIATTTYCPTKPAIRPTHLDWLLQDSTANRTDKIFVNIPLETGYIIPHVSSLKPRSWKE